MSSSAHLRRRPAWLRRSVLLSLLLWLAGLLAPANGFAAAPATEMDKERLASEARLLLSDRCATCHGPDEATRTAELRLDQAAGVFRETQNGGAAHVVTPGSLAASELFRRITSEDAGERMPPPEAGLDLSDAEIALLQRWIEAGAPWHAHWSFAPLDLEASPPPLDRARLRAEKIDPHTALQTGVDAFVIDRLLEEGLQPTAAAERSTLLRRLSFDLTGLPPTPAEIEAFLADPSPTAYRKQVDRLLASPRFGERMAAPWLDAARYADTFGYQADVYREMWPWRDWVISAFNEGMPYDQFLTWQIAGDQLPNATRQSRLATAFNRNHRQTNEGGSIEEEFHAEYVSDRVNTLGTAVLGLTLECARCHDHKYDPVSQREYYQLFAFFNNIDESGLYSHFTDAVPTPTLRLPTEAQTRRLAEARKGVEAARETLQAAEAAHAERFAQWQAARQDDPQPLSLPDREARYPFDTVEKQTVPNEVEDGAPAKLQGGVAVQTHQERPAILLDGENHLETPVGGDFDRDDPFTIASWIQADRHHDRAVIWHRSRAWTDAGSRGYELLLEEGRLSAALIHFWPGNALRVRAVEPLPLDRWVHVAVTYDGSSRAAGLSLFVDGEAVEVEVVRDHLEKTIRGGGAKQFTIGARFRDRGFTGGRVADLQIFSRRLAALEIDSLPRGSSIEQAVEQALAEGRPAAVQAYHAAALDSPLRAARETLRSARQAESAIEAGIREIMVMEEMPTPRKTFVLQRGAYNAPGERVQPDVPASLPAMREDWPRNRLGLARWLTDPRNPLVARVAVNRLWQTVMGAGLTRTPEDFGRQGERPTHLELLDWLSAQLIRDDWDIKQTIRRIVLSGTYRQSAIASARNRQRDPDNTFLTRSPSRRLPVEMVRDGALEAGGLLAEVVGGPPVKPYQPEGLWREKSGSRYQRDAGIGSHRRSLYTFWKRTSPPPAMLIFDAPAREVCAARRRPTQTPLQSLVLLNDEQYVEAARGVALRALGQLNPPSEQAQEAPADPELLDRLALLLLGRPLQAREAVSLTRLLNEQRQLFTEQPKTATEFLAIGDLSLQGQLPDTEVAAVTVVAQTLMNYAPSLRQP